MALFTSKADRKVPLLTQFYQLEIIDSGDADDEAYREFISPELDRFLYLYCENFSDEAYENKEGKWSTPPSEAEDLDFMPERGWNDCAHYLQSIFAIFFKLYAIGETEELNSRNELNDYISIMDLLNRDLLNLQSIEFIEIKDGDAFIVKETDAPNDFFFYHNFFRDIADEIIEVIKKKSKICICDECKNPFIVMKIDQRFCSTRCRQRQGQRIRMRRLFER